MIKHEKDLQSSVNVLVSLLAWGNRNREVLGSILKGLSLLSGLMDWQEKRAWDLLGCRELDLGVGVLVMGDTAWFYLLLMRIHLIAILGSSTRIKDQTLLSSAWCL